MVCQEASDDFDRQSQDGTVKFIRDIIDKGIHLTGGTRTLYAQVSCNG